jgi:hypothetical protein
VLGCQTIWSRFAAAWVTEIEVYRFNWRSSFNGHAVVRIGRRGDRITLRANYHTFIYP